MYLEIVTISSEKYSLHVAYQTSEVLKSVFDIWLITNQLGWVFGFFFTFIAFNFFFFKIQNFKILKKVIILIFTIKFKIFTQLDFDFLKKMDY